MTDSTAAAQPVPEDVEAEEPEDDGQRPESLLSDRFQGSVLRGEAQGSRAAGPGQQGSSKESLPPLSNFFGNGVLPGSEGEGAQMTTMMTTTLLLREEAMPAPTNLLVAGYYQGKA